MPGRQSVPDGHQNAYRGGVLTGAHWAEDVLANDNRSQIPRGLVMEPSPYLTSNQVAFPAEGRYGVCLNRVDLDKTYACVPREELLCHHNADNSSTSALLALNSLTYGVKQIGEPSVQQYMWQARKQHDFKVPVKRIAAGPDADTYVSAAGKPTGQLLPKAMFAGGTRVEQVTRDSTAYYPRRGGEFSKSLDTVHRRTGLRG